MVAGDAEVIVQVHADEPRAARRHDCCLEVWNSPASVDIWPPKRGNSKGAASPRHPADTVARTTARDEATRHIQEHSLGEAARIGRLSRIREFVLGAQDGLLVPLGVVTGMAAAHPAAR